jgi:hypothetical protein
LHRKIRTDRWHIFYMNYRTLMTGRDGPSVRLRCGGMRCDAPCPGNSLREPLASKTKAMNVNNGLELRANIVDVVMSSLTRG